MQQFDISLGRRRRPVFTAGRSLAYPAVAGVPAVTVVVPTYNEAGNIAELVRRLERAAEASPIEAVIFVDDSSDETPEVIDAVAAMSRIPVQLLQRAPADRVGGLSGAVLAGIEKATTQWVLVMDGDLQHPPEDVPRVMAAAAQPGGADLVVASRYCTGGATDGLSGWLRRAVSLGSIAVARLAFPRRLAGCSDTMTGFFAVRREALDLAALQPRGFKVLLEILGRNDLEVTEVGFEFAERTSGTSKASVVQGWHFLQQLARLRIDAWRGGHVGRAAWFAAIGLLGLVLDVGLFNLLLAASHRPLSAKLISSSIAVVPSYFMNRHWTWRDRPRGRTRRELLTFATLSMVGVGIAELCLLTSHYVLGLTTVLDDNVSANVIGLATGMTWRYWAYNRWAFPEAGVPIEVPVPARLHLFERGSLAAHTGFAADPPVTAHPAVPACASVPAE